MRTLFLVSALVLLSSCKGTTGLAGSGTTRTETRPVAAFTRLDASTPVEVEVAHGAAGPLTITVDDNLLSHLQTEVTGDRLRVRFDTQVQPTAAKITVRVPHLAEVHGVAAAHVNAEGIDEDRFAVEASSGAQVHVSGAAKALDARASSGATVDATGLSAPSAEVRASSGATVKLGAPGAVNGDVSSGAKVMLAAEPRTNGIKSSSGGEVRIGGSR